MRVRLSDPRLVEDLLEFLADRLDAVQARVAPDEIEVSPPGSLNARAAALALDRQLEAWEAAHPGVRASRRMRS